MKNRNKKLSAKRNKVSKRKTSFKRSARKSTSITKTSNTKAGKLARLKTFVGKNKLNIGRAAVMAASAAFIANNLRKNPMVQNQLSQMKAKIVKLLPITKAILGELFADSYDIGTTLGQGAFGAAYLAKDKKTGAQVVIKSIKLKPNDAFATLLLQNELGVLQKLASLKNNTYTTKYITHKYHEDSIYMVFSYDYPDTLEKLIKNNALSSTVKDTIFIQAIKGLKFLHNNNITHNDIKDANIIADKSTGNIKYIDFGLACDRSCVFASGGTPLYKSPELLLNKITPNAFGVLKMEDSRRADVWALGITLYILLYGKHPPLPNWHLFGEPSQKDYQDMDNILANGINYNDNNVDAKYSDILKLMLVNDPVARIKADKIKLSGVSSASKRGGILGFFGF